MSANNTKGDQCMDWTSNHRDAVDIIKSFRKRHGLEGMPLYGLGVSVGGGFVLKLPEYLKVRLALSACCWWSERVSMRCSAAAG